MKDLDKYTNIICSIHSNSILFNVWDYLSAKGLSYIYNVNNIIWLPNNINKISWNNIIYWWGWMIRPNFYNREIFQYHKWFRWRYSIIWVWVNNDLKSEFKYTIKDLLALKDWIDNSEYISVRDFDTYSFIKNIIYKWNIIKKVDVDPCPSYIVLKKFNITKNSTMKYKIGIVPSFWHTKWYLPFVNNIKKLITDWSNKYSPNQIIILCHDKNDLEIAKTEFSHIKSVIIKEFYDVIKYYSKCEKIITARAHGIIFSAALWIKCSPIYLSDKIWALYKYHYWINHFTNKPIFNINYHILENNYSPTNIIWNNY